MQLSYKYQCEVHVDALPYQQEPQSPWFLMGVVSIPAQSTDIDSPRNASTSTTLLSSLSDSKGSILPKYFILNSRGERSEIAFMPNTAVPLPAFVAALSSSTLLRVSSNSLNLASLSFAVAYYDRNN